MRNAYAFDRYPREVAAGREAGLAKFFAGVYGWMTAGVAVSGLTSLLLLSQPRLLFSFAQNPMFMLVAFFLQVGIAATFSSRASQMSTFAAANLFFAYAALMGVVLAPLAYIYTGASLTQAFFTAAATFAGLGVYGAATKRNLTGVGQFVSAGIIGGILLLVVNMFLHNAALDWAVNMALLLVFMAAIAYEHQQLRQIYAFSGTAGNMSLVGAFSLYVTLVNLTLTLLRLFGVRREET